MLPPTAGGVSLRGLVASKSTVAVGWMRYSPKRWSSTPVRPVTVSPPRSVLVALNGWPSRPITAAGFCVPRPSSSRMLRSFCCAR